MSKTYIKFSEITSKCHQVLTLRGDPLGTIEWYPKWKQWVFDPDLQTVWSDDCLEDVQKFMRGLEKQ